MNTLHIADKTFVSRLFLGTGKFGNLEKMTEAIRVAESELVTMALKRVDLQSPTDDLLQSLDIPQVHLLPNTSGARNAAEAVLAAQLAREALETNWVKLEIHPDPRYLLPDPIETLKATEELAKMGFVVMPYIHADPVLCKRLEDAGTAVVMPLGAPIGSNKGLRTIDFLNIIIEQSKVPVVVDAGIGAPSDAAKAMEIGADAVLVNTAIAVATDPVLMAIAFKEAVMAGRKAYEAGIGAVRDEASASSPLTSFCWIKKAKRMETFETVFGRYDWLEVKEKIYNCTALDVQQVLAKNNRDIGDFLKLLSLAAAPFLEPMAQLSQQVTQRRFGKTIQLYALCTSAMNVRISALIADLAWIIA